MMMIMRQIQTKLEQGQNHRNQSKWVMVKAVRCDFRQDLKVVEVLTDVSI